MPKQSDLPNVEGEGVAPKKIKAIDIAADEYVTIRDKRMAMTEKEVAARDKLVDLMKQNGLEVYFYSDQKVYIKHGQDKVRVCTNDGEAPEEGED